MGIIGGGCFDDRNKCWLVLVANFFFFGQMQRKKYIYILGIRVNISNVSQWSIAIIYIHMYVYILASCVLYSLRKEDLGPVSWCRKCLNLSNI